ncbi:MAG: hypothetical protein OK474_12695, partial [Thaumarchaeota archaeon]|nr:hypothetical protein [Nitrososphaerota archaeon]
QLGTMTVSFEYLRVATVLEMMVGMLDPDIFTVAFTGLDPLPLNWTKAVVQLSPSSHGLNAGGVAGGGVTVPTFTTSIPALPTLFTLPE